MRQVIGLVLALAGIFLAASVHAQQPSTADAAEIRQTEALLQQLHPVSGDVKIAQADVTLRLGKDYYFLPADEAKRVLVEGWGNHPDSVGDVLGMVFPADKTFLDDTWGAVITYEATGYVSDEDAHSADYDALLADLQQGEEELNAERVQQGYPTQHLVGWAEAPSYDAKQHSVIWAQNVRFGDASENTLNYDVRLLGRRGVLSLNMVTGMSKLAETRAAATKFAGAAAFNQGARYADYQAGTDARADYGVAGLVAAGVGAAAAKKLGLFAIILAFGKKFIILIIAGFALLGRWGMSLIGRSKKAEDDTAEQSYGEEAVLDPPAAEAPERV